MNTQQLHVEKGLMSRFSLFNDTFVKVLWTTSPAHTGAREQQTALWHFLDFFWGE